MKYTRYLIIGLAVVVVAALGIRNREQPQPNSDPQTAQQEAAVQDNWETKIDDQPPVTVTVTPLALGTASGNWKFQIGLDTHSGDLDSDMLESTFLVDDKGNEYRPVAWEGAGPGGHHREGVLVFDAVTPVPSVIELRIKDVGGVPERSLTWDLE